ncbi:MAG TPA: hypothetical protein VMF30_12795 [Pirellulales bacterium]|nr:hypothetical protein [Pirellulales bacterium]
MKTLVAFCTALTLGNLASANPARAQQLPAAAPTDWSLLLRYHGTTESADQDYYFVRVSTNGIAPGSITAVWPKYNDDGSRESDEPSFHGKLPHEKMAAVYQAARSVILNHTLGSPPAVHVEDGTTAEITIASHNRRISAVFDHSGFAESKEFVALRETLNGLLPKDFKFMKH